VSFPVICQYFGGTIGYYVVDIGQYFWRVVLVDGNSETTLIDQNGILKPDLVYVDPENPQTYGLRPFDDTYELGTSPAYPHTPKGPFNHDNVANTKLGKTTPWFVGSYQQGRFNTGINVLSELHNPTDTLTFKLIGQHYGKIRAEFIVEKFAWSDECGWSGGPKWRGETVAVYQEAYLVDCWGELTLKPSTTPGHTYLFEEGDTVEFEISTGYSGPSGEGRWVFRPNENGQPTGELDGVVRNMDGEILSYSSSYGGYIIPSNHENYKLYWDIPGDFIDDITKEYYFKLYNSYTDVDTQQAYIAIEGAAETGPKQAHASFDASYYEEGDEIKITMWADKGERDISFFRARIYTDPHQPFSTNIEGSPFNIYEMDVNGDTYSATLSYTHFTRERLYFRIYAIDSLGIPGPEFQTNIFIAPEDESNRYKIEVNVIDHLKQEPVSGVTVFIPGYAPRRTNHWGNVFFDQLPNGRYPIRVEHERYITQKQEIVISGEDEDVTVVLKGALQLFPLLISLLVLVASILISYVLPLSDHRIKYIIVIAGAILALVLYLITAGILVYTL